MIVGRAKLAFFAAVFAAAAMLVLGGASRAEAHGRYNSPVQAAGHRLAAADVASGLRVAFALEFDGAAPVRAHMAWQEMDRQPPAPDRSDDNPCCGAGVCHAGVTAPSPAPALLDVAGAKLPLPRCYGLPARMPSGIERPPRRPSTI